MIFDGYTFKEGPKNIFTKDRFLKLVWHLISLLPHDIDEL